MSEIKKEIKAAFEEIIIESTKPTLTIEEAAAYSGVGRDSIRRLVATKSSNFPHFKIGTKVLINRKMLDHWLEASSSDRKTY